MQTHRFISFFTLCLLLTTGTRSQMITGIWTGRINHQKVELKIIQRGDSLTGTSYYGSPSQYRRYRIRGYFDAGTNEAVWWDDALIDEKPASSGNGRMALLSRADFNCPGDGKMTLDGKTGKKEEAPSGEVHLDKTATGSFSDEWDYVIDNYTMGGNDPDLIDSIESLAPVIVSQPPPRRRQGTTAPEKPPVAMTYIPPMPEPKKQVTVPAVPPLPETIEQKYITRRKTFVTDIPLTGDSIELRFYDNAEIDGDSISLFLDDQLIYHNIRLTGNAYTIKLAVSGLKDNSELVMVAENLGSIPPNTSLMVALVGDKRYEAKLESTEGSSAMVRFRRAMSAER